MIIVPNHYKWVFVTSKNPLWSKLQRIREKLKEYTRKTLLKEDVTGYLQNDLQEIALQKNFSGGKYSHRQVPVSKSITKNWNLQKSLLH